MSTGGLLWLPLSLESMVLEALPPSASVVVGGVVVGNDHEE